MKQLEVASESVKSDSTANGVVVHAQSMDSNTTKNSVKKIFLGEDNILGIAKDGHAIFGPYYSDGSEATAGLDICNGANLDTDGDKITDTYGYFIEEAFHTFYLVMAREIIQP